MSNKEQQGQFSKKPKLSRAETAALQERQRAEKAARLGQAAPKPTPKGQQKQQAPPNQKQIKTNQRQPALSKEEQNQVRLFSHLPQYQKGSTVAHLVNSDVVPPEIVKLGLKYTDWSISGSNARCVAMLTAFKTVIKEYVTPPGKSLHRDMEPHLRPSITFLVSCRPLSMSMGNAINFVKNKITQTGQMSEEEAKEYLISEIDNFITERVVVSKFIAEKGNSKIVDGDVVLTFASSTSVEKTLKLAHDSNKKFRVIIVDARPTLEGKNLLYRLASYGLECCYILYHGVSFVMMEVTKVFLGAFAMLSNGNLLSRVGTAGVAMMAHRFNIPVMVCCETYKFVDRAYLDSICFNELGNPDQLIEGGSTPLDAWRENNFLKLLNITHDLTPAEFLHVIITEVGLIPPTSVPVILREQNSIDGE